MKLANNKHITLSDDGLSLEGYPDGKEKEFKERYTFGLKSTVRNIEVSFETEDLNKVLENMHTFLHAVGFTYVGKLVAISRDEKKEWESGE